MANRNIPEINAGSMADIAFLLLIFWLVTTTMDRDLGLRARLPVKIDVPDGFVPPPIRDRNVLEIYLNANDEVMIEDKRQELTDVTLFVQDFYLKDGDDMPERIEITSTFVRDTLASLRARSAEEETQAESLLELFHLARLKKSIEDWEGYSQSHQLLGDFMALKKTAVIRFESNNGSSYDAYYSILDQINHVLQVERNQLALEKFGMKYEQMERMQEHDPSLRSKIRAIRHRFPLKLLEPSARGI